MTLTAVLFAGGMSSRMGSDKAQIQIHGQPLWERQMTLLRSMKPECIWVSARARPVWCPAEISVILDGQPSRGPMSGLASALSQNGNSHLLALAIDLPKMAPQFMRRLLQSIEPGRGVIPVKRDQLEPLCAIYPREAASMATEALNRGELSLQSLIRHLERQNLLRRLPVSTGEEEWFLNLNTPEDLAQVNGAR